MRIGCRFLRIVLLGAYVLLPVRGEAATWRVEKDGSGDFTTIQAAVDASSPGDVQLLGPGRYDNIHPVLFPNGVFRVIADVDVAGLTLRGTDARTVVIGPAQPAQNGEQDWGLVTRLGVPSASFLLRLAQ